MIKINSGIYWRKQALLISSITVMDEYFETRKKDKKKKELGFENKFKELKN